jgi:hypothetical protein
MYAFIQNLEVRLYCFFGVMLFPYISSPFSRRVERAVMYERLKNENVELLYRISAVRKGYYKYSRYDLMAGINWDGLPERWKISVDITLLYSGFLSVPELPRFLDRYFFALQKRVYATLSGVQYEVDPFELVVDGELSIISKDNDVFDNSYLMLHKLREEFDFDVSKFELMLEELRYAIAEYYS